MLQPAKALSLVDFDLGLGLCAVFASTVPSVQSGIGHKPLGVWLKLVLRSETISDGRALELMSVSWDSDRRIRSEHTAKIEVMSGVRKLALLVVVKRITFWPPFHPINLPACSRGIG